LFNFTTWDWENYHRDGLMYETGWGFLFLVFLGLHEVGGDKRESALIPLVERRGLFTIPDGDAHNLLVRRARWIW